MHDFESCAFNQALPSLLQRDKIISKTKIPRQGGSSFFSDRLGGAAPRASLGRIDLPLLELLPEFADFEERGGGEERASSSLCAFWRGAEDRAWASGDRNPQPYLTFRHGFWYHTRPCWRDGRAWLNAHDSKSCIPARVSGVRIPLSPPNVYSAGVIQWQNRSFPSFLRGFDSHRPLQSSP